MKIYTKTGDRGMTSLVGGQRVAKNSARLESYGTVDELNSCLGIVRAYVSAAETAEELVEIQSRLFDLGGNLATDPADLKVKVCIREEDIAFLDFGTCHRPDGCSLAPHALFCPAGRQSCGIFLPFGAHRLPEGGAAHSGFGRER